MWLSLIALIFTLMLPAPSRADSVTEVLGVQAACDPTVDSCLFFPSVASILCNGVGGNLDCPQFFHPDWSQPAGSRFFGITNRVNPPRYLVSTNGGSTWTLTTTQPFVAAVLNSGSSMAVASDGSLLAASGQGANLCVIRKSIDQGANWSTKFTSLVQNCSIGFGTPTPPGMYCASLGGYCAFVNPFSGATLTIIYSTDSGDNWTIGVAFAAVSADSKTWGPILSSGTGQNGIVTRGLNATGGGNPFGKKVGNDFQSTTNYVVAQNQFCRPIMISNSARAICRPAAGPTGNVYSFVDGTIPVTLNTFQVADTGTASTFEPFVAQFNGTYGYLLQPSFANPNFRLNIFATATAWGQVSLIGQVTPLTALIPGCCTGNFMKWGTKLYYSSGGTATNAFFGVIQ